MRSGLEAPPPSVGDLPTGGGRDPDGLAGLLSPTELQAAMLDGELFRVGDTFASIGVQDDPPLRALAFAEAFGELGLVAERLSAAWIWGATSRPPGRHTACAPVGARWRGPVAGLDVRETQIDAEDVVLLGTDSPGPGPVTVTSPTRTVLDLLRDRVPFGDAELAAVAGLLDRTPRPWTATGPPGRPVTGVDLPAVRRSLEAAPGLPYGRQALRRLARVMRTLPRMPSDG
jgi:hypothetical protein